MVTWHPLDRQLAVVPVADFRMTARRATACQLVAAPAAEPRKVTWQKTVRQMGRVLLMAVVPAPQLRKVTWQKTVQQLAALSVLHREHLFPLRCSVWGDGSCVVDHYRRWKKDDENLVKAFPARQNLQRLRDQLVAP